MAWDDPFLLGPLGAMRELPSPPAGGDVAVTPTRIGGIWESLGGSTVVDLWRVRREWDFAWPDRYPAQVERILRAWHGLDRRPRRLLDPMHGPNLATLDLSTGGGESRSTREFTVGSSSGSASFSPTVALPADMDGVTGACVWQVPESSSNVTLRAGTRRTAPALDRPVCVSTYLRGSGPARVQAIGHRADGTTETHPGAQITLTAAWQRVSAVVPAGAVQAVSGGLWAAAGAARTVESTGWQIEHSTEPSAWSLGGGCPRVVLLGHDHAYRRLNRRDFTLTLREVP